MGAYKLIKEMTDSDERLFAVIEFLKSHGFLNANQEKALKRPGQSNKFRTSIILGSIIGNIDPISRLPTENPMIRDLIVSVRKETYLILKFDDEKTFLDIFSKCGIEHGKIRGITKIKSNLSHPYVIQTENGNYFLRYTAPFGGRYITRADPREVIFQNLLCEYIFRELLGEGFVTRTLYPSLEEADSRRKLDDNSEDLERLCERLIIQPCYTPRYGELYERIDLTKAGKIFGDLVGRIHGLTMGFNNSKNALGNLERFRPEIRDRTIEEYMKWLNESCWVKGRFEAVKKLGSDVTQYLEGIGTLDWDHCVQRSYDFWQKGAVLTHLDLRPKNTFYNESEGTKIFDFDYMAFYDPSYHAAQAMFFAVRDAIEKGEINSFALAGILSNFIDGYFGQLQSRASPDFLKSSGFRENILDYFAMTAMSRYLSDHLSGLTGLEQVQALHATVKSIRDDQIGKIDCAS